MSMSPQEKLEFDELKRTVASLKAVTDVPFIENIKRRIDLEGVARLQADTAISEASINDLSDVDISSVTNGQVLKWTTSGVDRWINGTDNT